MTALYAHARDQADNVRIITRFMTRALGEAAKETLLGVQRRERQRYAGICAITLTHVTDVSKRARSRRSVRGGGEQTRAGAPPFSASLRPWNPPEGHCRL